MRLIDADALGIGAAKREVFVVSEYADGWNGAIEIINNAPTISPDSLVKRGRWIEKPFLLGTSNFCSLCDSFYGMPHGKFKYCPNCGAKMIDGEAGEDE